MRWILGTGSGIEIDDDQLNARRVYIHRVTGAEVSVWKYLQVNEVSIYFCISIDSVNGTFITAHIDSIPKLCTIRDVYDGEVVVVNSCIWRRMVHKELLHRMMATNRSSELFFAKQELSIDKYRNFRQTTTIDHKGEFCFQTSRSERELFVHRKKGFKEALNKSFVRVSPILMLGD